MKQLRWIFIIVLSLASLVAIGYGQQNHSEAYLSAARKIAWLGENGHSPNPSTRPTTLTADEWNAYINEGGVKLPEGVSHVQLSSQPAVVHGIAEVDFDRFTSNRTRNKPLLTLFTGKHHVTCTAQAAAANGVATVRVQSIEFDGVAVPRFLLEYFSDRFLRPRYGNAIGMDSTFRLHSRIDAAVLGVNQVTITQR